MAISIDGIEHSMKFEVKYGDDFPKPRRSMEVIHSRFGKCLIYVTSVGIPEWTNRMTVLVPMKFYITQIIDPSKKYLINQKRKTAHLKLVKG